MSLHTARMNLRNTSLQVWCKEVLAADQKDRPNRLSSPYFIPTRHTPHWMSLPRRLQGWFSQLLTGRAVLQTFLGMVDPD